MIGYIYKTTDLTNNKIYIGKHESTTFDLNYFGSGRIIKSKLKKYGPEIFKCELLESAETLEELWEKEIFWIKYFNATNSEIGYNLSEGGCGGQRNRSYLKVTKDDKSKRIRKDELDQYLNEGWIHQHSRRYEVDHKEERRQYKKEWAQKNAERLKLYQQQYREKNKEKLKLKSKLDEEKRKKDPKRIEYKKQYNKNYYQKQKLD